MLDLRNLDLNGIDNGLEYDSAYLPELLQAEFGHIFQAQELQRAHQKIHAFREVQTLQTEREADRIDRALTLEQFPAAAKFFAELDDIANSAFHNELYG